MAKPAGWPMAAGTFNRYFNALPGYIQIYEIPSDIMVSESTTLRAEFSLLPILKRIFFE